VWDGGTSPRGSASISAASDGTTKSCVDGTEKTAATAHAAINKQPSLLISQGCAAFGQQSWSPPSDIDISAGTGTAALATGRSATESAIRRADRVRAIAMSIKFQKYLDHSSPSIDKFASGLAVCLCWQF
jgi:hypothetical protein